MILKESTADTTEKVGSSLPTPQNFFVSLLSIHAPVHREHRVRTSSHPHHHLHHNDDDDDDDDDDPSTSSLDEPL